MAAMRKMKIDPSELTGRHPAAVRRRIEGLERLLEGASEKTTQMPVPKEVTGSHPPTPASRGPVLVVIAVLALVLILLLYMLAVRR